MTEEEKMKKYLILIGFLDPNEKITSSGKLALITLDNISREIK